jgi:hypothetical protein
VAGRVVDLLAAVLRVIGLVIAAILVIHILLAVFGANPANAFAVFIGHGADTFSLGLVNLFTLANPKIAVAVSYGIPAVIWLVITTIVVAVVRRAGSGLGSRSAGLKGASSRVGQ